jgi:hypothetical protein
MYGTRLRVTHNTNMEDELASLAGSKYFATLDLMQGYWQLPLHEDSQECQSIITPA